MIEERKNRIYVDALNSWWGCWRIFSVGVQKQIGYSRVCLMIARQNTISTTHAELRPNAIKSVFILSSTNQSAFSFPPGPESPGQFQIFLHKTLQARHLYYILESQPFYYYNTLRRGNKLVRIESIKNFRFGRGLLFFF